MKKKPKKMATRKTYKKRKASPPARKSRRRRMLSQAGTLPVIGKIGLDNPLIGGIIGATAAMWLKNRIPDDLFTDPSKDEPSALQPYIKGLAITGAALIAKNYKYDAIAGGMMAAAAVLTLQNLKAPGLAEMRSANYADPSILMSETALLSQSIYPEYMPLYETELLSEY